VDGNKMAETTGKKRIIAVIAIAVLIIGGGVFLYQSNKSEDTKAKTSVKVTRSEIDYTPGLSDSKEYNEKENQYNQEVLKESLANGESNVPAITNNSAVKKAEQDAFDAFKEIDKVEEKKVESKEPPKVEPQIVYVDRPVEKIVERKIMVPVQAPAQTNKVDESKQQEEFDQKSLEAMKKAFASLKSSYNTTTIQSYEAPRVAKVQESTAKSKQNVVSADEKQKNIIVRAGTILSGEIITAIDTDTLGVVVAEITTGKLKGARLLGSVTNAPTSVTDVVQKVSVKFDKIKTFSKALNKTESIYDRITYFSQLYGLNKEPYEYALQNYLETLVYFKKRNTKNYEEYLHGETRIGLQQYNNKEVLIEGTLVNVKTDENGYITNSTYLPAKYVDSSPDNNFAFEPVI